jgi:vacuolar-type H+-ATPase subunit I/STV1
MLATLIGLPATALAGAGAHAAIKKAAEGGNKMAQAVAKVLDTAGKIGSDATSNVKEEEGSEELHEALETVETLRKELNETNLLNAKLLYVNKVFKANNLNESQKANVIAAFDKAETVKEVKLVFETVSENIPSGNKKEVVREARGFASAAVGKSDKPEVITEANQAVLRMQKLAGIIK